MAEGKRAAGRALDDFRSIEGWNADRLYPAERKLLRAVAAGEFCATPGHDTTRPGIPARPDAGTNLVRAGFLRFLATGGDGAAPVHERGVQLAGAWIECGDDGLDFEACTVPRNLNLWHCRVDGSVLLRDASVKTVNLTGSSLVALHGDGMRASGALFLRDGFRAADTVRLLGAQIAGSVDFGGARLDGYTVSLHCDRLAAGGSVSLANGFYAAGPVRFLAACIDNNLSCRGATLCGAETALDCEGARIGGGAFLDSGEAERPFLARGRVDLTNVHIEGILSLAGAVLSSKEQAIKAAGLHVGGSLRFDGAMIAGPVSLASATIGADLTMEAGAFEQGATLARSRIDGTLFWRGLAHFAGRLSLDHVHAGSLSFDRESWAMPSQVDMDGFRYEVFRNLPSECEAHYWTESFLGTRRHQSAEDDDYAFRPQAHEQLAAVLMHMGHEEDARTVRIDKRRVMTRRQAEHYRAAGPTPVQTLTLAWNRFVMPIVDYGFRPGKAAIYLVAIWLAGTAIYAYAAQQGIMTPTHPLIYKEAYGRSFEVKSGGRTDAVCRNNWTTAACAASVPSEYSEFSALVYSADVILPIVDFRQQSDWSPRVVHDGGTEWRLGHVVRLWEWIATFLGWALSLLFVSGLTGIIRRE